MDNCSVLFGDQIDAVVRWDKGSNLDSLDGKAMRLRFELKDADLYSMRFRPR